MSDLDLDVARWGRLWKLAIKLSTFHNRPDIAMVFAQLVEADLLTKTANLDEYKLLANQRVEQLQKRSFIAE